MPDLLGPNPCERCRSFRPQGATFMKCTDYSQPDRWCPDRFAYLKCRELIEALKAGGVRFDKHGDPEGMSYDQFDYWLGQIHGPGHLIFIPEAQEC